MHDLLGPGLKTRGHYKAMTLIRNRMQILLMITVQRKMVLPVFVGNDASLHLLVVLANTNGQPGAQLSIVEGVHDAEHLALVKT